MQVLCKIILLLIWLIDRGDDIDICLYGQFYVVG